MYIIHIAKNLFLEPQSLGSTTCNNLIMRMPSPFAKRTRLVCEKQMPPIIVNSKDGQGHNEKYLGTNRKILSLEMLTCKMKVLIFLI